jgi:hypothetical protein
MRGVSAAAILIGMAVSFLGQQGNDAKPPRFEDYPVAEVFRGTPAAPVLVTLNSTRTARESEMALARAKVCSDRKVNWSAQDRTSPGITSSSRSAVDRPVS